MDLMIAIIKLCKYPLWAWLINKGLLMASR